MPVPPFMTITSSDYIYFQREGYLPSSTLNDLKSFLKKSSSQFFAVRSSATSEDGEDESYAGMLDTFLYVKEKDIINKIYECFQSLNNERLIAYQELKNIDPTTNLMAVVIQEMIPSEFSGVLFTRSPDLDDALVYLELGIGLGEGVVSGQVDIDRYYIDRNFKIISAHINEKENCLNYNSTTSSIEEINFKEKKRDTLAEESLINLTKLALKIEQHFGYPCDIEWTYSKGNLYILQARPITTKYEKLDLYIDTNLSESYPGHIAPISADFVNSVYDIVHLELAQYIGFSKERIDSLRPYFKTMTNYIGGHMYYKLESYYNILLSIPGGKQNLKNWHRMIGGNDKYINIETTIDEPDTRDTINYYKFLFKIIFNHKNIFKRFITDSSHKKKELYQSLYKSRNIYEKIDLYNYGLKSIKGFSLTAFNDVLAMKGLNLICNILDKYNISHEVLPNLIQTDDGVESLMPLTKVQIINSNIKNKDEFFSLFEDALSEYDYLPLKERYDAIFSKLSINGYENCAERIKEFLDQFGSRSFEELKLESLTLKQSPESLFDLLKLHSDDNSLKMSSTNSNGEKDNNSKETRNNLDGLKYHHRFLIGFLAKTTQKYIATREHCRLIRGEFYGWFRDCLLEIFEDLKKTNELKDIPLEDFFYIQYKDLQEFRKRKLTFNEIKTIIQNNKKVFKPIEDYPEFIYKSKKTASSYFSHKLNDYKSNKQGPSVLEGLAASQGNITGVPLILNNPKLAIKKINFENSILVTKNTDPAWVYIMTKCKGLISEKGSLLSHTAIIGRELGVPTLVGVKDATSALKGKTKIQLDANQGQVKVIQ